MEAILIQLVPLVCLVVVAWKAMRVVRVQGSTIDELRRTIDTQDCIIATQSEAIQSLEGRGL